MLMQKKVCTTKISFVITFVMSESDLSPVFVHVFLPDIFPTDTYEIVTEKENCKLEMNVGFHFASTLRSAVSSGDAGSAARARRLAQDFSSLSSSLPLNYSSSVFVRCDEERLDIMKVEWLLSDVHMTSTKISIHRCSCDFYEIAFYRYTWLLGYCYL